MRICLVLYYCILYLLILPQNEVSNLTPSESCQSSDEDSDVGAMQGFYLENQSEMTEYAVPLYVDTACSPSSQAPLIEHLEIPVNII